MMTSGWGRYPRADCILHHPRDEDALAALVRGGPVIARGNGRSYGDSALNRAGTIDMRGFDRFVAFDDGLGQLVAEAGVLLADIIEVFLPRGWFPAVTPGTRHVTLGGMIAADVHGKNHHRDGSLRNFIDWIELMGADGQVRRIDRNHEAELFEATIGGMGLTGIILRAAIRLRRVQTGWMRERVLPAANLSELIALFARHADAPYSVAWIDCLATGDALGRGLLMLGDHASPEDLPARDRGQPFDPPRRRARRVPFDAPGFALNRFSVRAFNALYWQAGLRRAAQAGPAGRLTGWEAYFYPLDAVADWNRIYGRRGFAQFQCALPLDQSEAGLQALMDAITRSGLGSFLSVLKRLGGEAGPLSFPMEGFTLALDFPLGPHTLALLDTLDRIVLEHGGRFYLAKDSRMSRATIQRSDSRVPGFTALRQRLGCSKTFTSLQSERLNL